MAACFRHGGMLSQNGGMLSQNGGMLSSCVNLKGLVTYTAAHCNCVLCPCFAHKIALKSIMTRFGVVMKARKAFFPHMPFCSR